MSSVTSKSQEKDESVTKRYNVPIKLNDASFFDGAYTFMKEKFTEEMRRIDDEMELFSKILNRLDTEGKSYRHSVTSERDIPRCFLETIANSPLVVGEGENKTLRLQFDVSQFSPGEVVVKIIDNNLVVTAHHKVKSDASVIHNQYHREFLLPSGINPREVESALSKDGVLIVRAPLSKTILAA